MANKESILETLAAALPLDLELHFYHISTPPAPTTALFSPPPGQSEERTFCENHFIAASLPANNVLRRELLIFAIEVLVFTSHDLTTIFVSKADSTGYLHLLNSQPGGPSIIKTICTTVLSFFVQQSLHGPRILLSLFARSQNQYLFPGSIENSGKHVLEDRQLIKWWCQTLDPVLREHAPTTLAPSPVPGSDTSSEAYIVVPGCDRFETRGFLPSSTKSDSVSRWTNSYPRDLIVPDGSAPPRCLIPRFPDDPKARFLDDLDSEISAADLSTTGSWRSVGTLDHFWEMMSYRQECSAGRLVGFIWIVFTPRRHGEISHDPPVNCPQESAEHSGQAVEQLPTPNQSQVNSLDPILPPPSLKDDSLDPINAASPPPSSPVLALANEIHNVPMDMQDGTNKQNNLANEATQSGPANQKIVDSLFYDDAKTIPARWPLATRGDIVLSEQTYQELMNHLLQTDFANQDVATQSTASWIKKASDVVGISSWGQRLTGRKPVVPIVRSNRSESNTTVNVLMGVRKKRKAADSGDATNVVANAGTTEAGSTPEAATLPADSTRKKYKVAY
ncbi:hypothetical protein EPUS_07142 [Endocarpon pusillum Z07020]|uniref:histone acetyltransferase n=1 Tax=Endocarpon pusillum (strain Z07020 / HMAS-L-300199) TaxID=1263415 RepID=U1HIL2_ENDPU|nr:uncharacterized protein EPUS_07142 [Endocarpon pusillum Z07020]ERF68724.1 hypothetical protein EPUS_07142 [Endocarpon pusillum Z07020]